MTHKIFTLGISLILFFALATPVGAISYGEPDGNAHPNVGSIVLSIEGELWQ